MPYSAEISRSNPSCFLFLIDQSGSMQEVMAATNVQTLERPITVDGKTYTQGAAGKTKAQAVADAINRLLTNLIIKCTKSEGVRDFFNLGVIGYGGDSTANRVGTAFGGTLAGRDLVPISEIANMPSRIDVRAKKVDDGAGGIIEQKVKFPIWFEPIANGGTPMCQALSMAQSIVNSWVAQHLNCFPPVVINITDGESTDGDPSIIAEQVKRIATSDGDTLLFNIHISAQEGASIEFPDDESSLPDVNAKMLFRTSSQLPASMQAIARQDGIPVTETARGFAFNADAVALIRFLDIGTRASNLR